MPIPMRGSGVLLPILTMVSPAAAGTVSGSVVDRAGAGIAGAEIRFHPADEIGGPGPAAAVAGSDGSFSLEVPSAGPWNLWASASGYLDGRAGPVSCSDTGPTATVVVRLFHAGTGSMLGTVKDPDGAPIEGVRVEISQASFALGTPRTRTTDAEGRYAFEKLTVGQVSFRFELGGSQTVSPVEGTGASQVKKGEDLVRDVVFARPDRAIEGRALREDGSPLAGGKVVVLLRPTFEERYVFRGGETRTDETGRFRRENLVPGSYRVFVSAPSPVPGGPERFVGDLEGIRPGGAPVEFRVSSPLPVLVTGKILNLDNGQPLPGSKVRFEVEGAEPIADVSDVDGKFAFGARLSASHPNILRVEHRTRGTDERWLDPNEVRPDGSYPEIQFTVTRQRLDGESR